jgi:3-(3-hydroxy-phenyl)propionate hydroxylase
VATEADLGQWEGVHQLSDPARAGTYMRIGKTRYRWEFQLTPGEVADDYRDMARLHPLISPWTGDTPVAELEIIRCAEYTFRAQIADRWRDRRVFLLGDAAHLTPPFVGQGMCAGVRDAMNLAWKVAGVLDGTLAETVLDTYQIERKHHARAMIRLAKVIGTAMTAGGRVGDVIRRAVAPRLHLVPGLKELATDSQTPPLHRSDLVKRPRLRRTLAGRLCPNAILDGERRLDDVAAGRFAIVTSTEPPATLQADIERRGAVFITARPGSELHRWLRNGRAHAAIVRPDGTVLSAGRDLSAFSTILPGFNGNLSRPTTNTGG